MSFSPPGGRTERALARRLEQSAGFQLLSRALTDVIFVLDRSEAIVYAGEGVEAVLDSPRAALLGRPFRDCIEPGDRSGLPDRIGEADGPWEIRFSAGDGPRWVSVAAKDPTGLGGAGAGDDILEHLEGHVFLFVRTIGEERVSRDRIDLYRRTLDATNNVLVVSDARQEDNPVVFVNEHFLDVTGYRREEVMGRNCRFLQTRGDGSRDDDQDGVRRLARAIGDEEAIRVRIRNYRKDGTRFWNELFVTPIRDEGGEVTHFVGVQNDVTDRVEAEQQRDGHARLLEAFYDSVQLVMGVVELQPDGRVIHLSANAKGEDVYSVAPSEIRGKTPAELGYTESETRKWREHIEACRESGGPVRFGTTFPWDAVPGVEGTRTFTVVVSEVDRAARLYSYVVEDVTDQLRTESERSDLAAALEYASDGVVITDADMNRPGPEILYVNRAFEAMTGYTRDEVIGRNPRFMQGEMTGRVELDRLRRTLEAGEPYRGELVNYTKAGEPYFVEVEIAPVRDADGVVRRFVSTQRDVTNRRRLEREVLQAATSAQEQIARDLHDGLGQVLTGTAFYLYSVVQRLRESGSPLLPDVSRAAGLVQDAQNQARSLAHSLYPFVGGGDAFFDALAQLASDASDAYGIRCTFATDLTEPIESDETTGHLYRIVQEALTNAVRHGRPSTLHVRLSPLPAPNGGTPSAVLTVEDDGSGIKDSEAGGMGMSTMQYRTRQIGGVLKVDSPRTGGTVVRVQFPLGVEAAAAPVDIYRD